MKLPIYFDYSATTPVDKRVYEKMIQYLTIDGMFGNPSVKSHKYGWDAEEAVDNARNYVANLFNADLNEIIFTSGATESNNLAIKGIAHALRNKGNHIITGETEHKSVLDTCKILHQEGFNLTILSPKKNGIIYPEQLESAFRPDTILTSLMHVNNEIGIIQNIKEFGELCKNNNIVFHVDATQSAGKLLIDLKKLKIDLMSFSAHKLYGPKGIGGLFVRNKNYIKIETQIHGGGQEFGLRSGTLPVHQIVGMGESYRIAKEELHSEALRLRKLRKILFLGLSNIGGIYINGNLNCSVPTILNLFFSEIDNAALILAIKDLAVSFGSACISNNNKSHVLQAIGLDDNQISNSIRFSLGRFTTIEEITYAIRKIQDTILFFRNN